MVSILELEPNEVHGGVTASSPSPSPLRHISVEWRSIGFVVYSNKSDALLCDRTFVAIMISIAPEFYLLLEGHRK